LLLALADTGIGADGKVMVVVDQFEVLFAFVYKKNKRPAP